ncbi:MAG: hypothetical protein FWE48_05265, partial [Coriobacteriia bacterium]|nr:hypothetical protein [Coriobacteriia bacterium]
MSKKVEKWLKPEGLKQIEEWAKQGISKHGIALMMGVHRTTLWEWCKEHESLRIAVEIGREYLIQDLQLALYNAALGEVATEATVIETEVFLDGREAVRKRNTTTRKEKPDTTALIFLLKNLSRYHPVSNPDGWLSDPATQFSRELTM